MKSFHLEKKEKKPLKLDTKVKLGTKINVKLMHKLFLGTCYITAVSSVALAIIFFVAFALSFPKETRSYLITQSANSVTLTWTAPGDDGHTGQASQYDIRYATFPINAENFSTATAVVNPPAPQIAGSEETFVVTGLNPDTLYYFALKTADEIPNWSEISNIATKKTAPIEACVPNWSCTSWSACLNGEKTRSCQDLNNCGTNLNKPSTKVKCTMPSPPPIEPETCEEKWSCTEWSDCLEGFMTRICLDKNNCGTENLKPEEKAVCGIGGGELEGPQERYLAVTPSAHGGPHLKIYAQDLSLYRQFFAYDPSFRRGVNTAFGDVTGNGEPEIITGTGPGSAPHLRIFDLKGRLLHQFYAYPADFRIGLSVAAADLNGNGIDEIIVAPQEMGGPHIRIFSYNRAAEKFELFKDFFAYPQHFRMGVNLAAADLNNNGLAEIIVAPRNAGGPHIRIFELNPRTKKFDLKNQFFAYAFGFRGGVSLATGDVDNDGIKEIITGAGPGGGPHVRIFDHRGNFKYQFFAANTNFRGGVDVAAMDFDRDGADEIITGAWSSGQPGVFVFDFDFKNKSFNRIHSFYAYDPLYQAGIRVTGY